MRPEDFAESAPGEVELTDGVFAFSPDPLPPDIDATHDLLTATGDAMYALGQLSDLDGWLDSPALTS